MQDGERAWNSFKMGLETERRGAILAMERNVKSRIGSWLAIGTWAAWASSAAGGRPVTNLTFHSGIGTDWAVYVGEQAHNGGPAGEWTAEFGGRAGTGYFLQLWATTMSSGNSGPITAVHGGCRAAWLIDRFATGLGNDGIPAGWSGGELSLEDKRTALAFAVFEVGTSPESDPPDLEDGTYRFWYAPAVPRQLAQAYLAELAAATIDTNALAAEYEVVTGEQWLGIAFARWVAKIEPPELTRIDVAPAQADLQVGETRSFAAEGFDQGGYPLAFAPVWTASGGRVDGAGTYVATGPGSFEVWAGAAGAVARGTGAVVAATMAIGEEASAATNGISFASHTSAVYSLQRRVRFSSGEWEDVPGGGPERGTGGELTLADTNEPASTTRFYRVRYAVEP